MRAVAIGGLLLLTGCAPAARYTARSAPARTGPGPAAVVAPAPSPTPLLVPTAADSRAPGRAATLACIRWWESRDDYAAAGADAFGAYQFEPPTWNVTARRAGRPDLVGVNPAYAAPGDQDALAAELLGERGLEPWPTPARRCA